MGDRQEPLTDAQCKAIQAARAAVLADRPGVEFTDGGSIDDFDGHYEVTIPTKSSVVFRVRVSPAGDVLYVVQQKVS